MGKIAGMMALPEVHLKCSQFFQSLVVDLSPDGLRAIKWKKKKTTQNRWRDPSRFESNGFSVKSNKFLCAEGPAPWRQQKQDMSLQHLTQHTGCSLSAVIYCFYSSTPSKNKTNIKTCNFKSLFENAFHVSEWVKQVSQSSMRTLSSRQMSAAVHNGPSFTGVNGCFQYRVLIQVWGIKSLQRVCWSMVVVLYGRFCATVFSNVLFGSRKSHYKKVPYFAYKSLTLSKLGCWQEIKTRIWPRE